MIKFAVVGYGNLGRACERIAAESKDFELVGIFTRRDPSQMTSPFGTPFFSQDKMADFVGKIDIMALCTGSANDLTDLGKTAIKYFNTIDSFDTHAKMRQYVIDMDNLAKENNHIALVGIGWDPGVFSLMRVIFDGVLSAGDTTTFWGKGVSQGHSEAIRKIAGVKKGIQYTIPKEDALEKARGGEIACLTTRDKHLRECFIVLADGADAESIKEQIVTMPNYFSDYDTIVNFISDEEFDKNHNSIPHGGFVLRSGEVNDTKHTLEFSLKLESNPNFTASVLMNYAKAAIKMYGKGVVGSRTILDIAPIELLDSDRMDTIEHYV